MLDYQKCRLVYRSITLNTNARTMVCTIIPPNSFFGHSLNGLSIQKSGIDAAELLYVNAVLSSYAFDYNLRLRVSTQLTMFYVYQLPVPRLTHGDRRFSDIVSRAARLICTTPEFDALAKQVGLGSHKGGATDEAERAQLRAELDGIIANLYGLTEEEFAYILTTFPLVPQSAKDAALEQYRAHAPKGAEQEVLAMIKAGESHTVEFKVTARWDVRNSKRSRRVEKVVLDSIAAFMNTEGGELLIGVRDDGSVAGLDKDYQLFGNSRNPKDAFENWLTQHLLDNYGKDVAPNIKISFPQVDGADICRISVTPTPRAVCVKDGDDERFFIRTGNSKRRLSVGEVVQYCKRRWPA